MFDNHKELTYFDIRLKTGGHKNTVLVRGNDAEVERVPIVGHVKILTLEDLHVKRVRLVLTGEFQIDYMDRTLLGHAIGQEFERNCVLKALWPNLLTSLAGELQFGDYGDLMVGYSKMEARFKRLSDASTADLTQLTKRPGFHRSLSLPSVLKNHEESLFTIPRAGVDGTPYPMGRGSANHSFLLPQGNYLLPFEVMLPANVPESVEGLRSGKIRYKLECHVERGRFERTFHAAKHFRIVRTLHHRNVNLYESIDFANTWPGKIDFQVSMLRKAVAIGSNVPIKLIIVPLVKGLSFKAMHAEVVQHYHVTGLGHRSPDFEEVLHRRKIECRDPFFGEDHWLIKGSYHFPSSLMEITQTCSIKNALIEVKHRVRVLIHIRNADGHVSELRANLPIHVFMSPNHGEVRTAHLEVEPHHGYFTADTEPDREDIIFRRRERDWERAERIENGAGSHNASRTVSRTVSEASDSEHSGTEEESDYEADRDANAPPLYQQHIYDTLYDQSSLQSPLEQLRTHGITPPVENGALSSHASSVNLALLLQIPCYEEAVDDDSDVEEEPAPLYPSDIPRPQLGARAASTTNLLTIKDTNRHHHSRLHLLRKEKW